MLPGLVALGRTPATIESLQMIIIEVEALLNDCPLTHSSPDPEPIISSHLLHGRRITTLPHVAIEDNEITDPNFRDIADQAQSKSACSHYQTFLEYR